jgi:hypothetical protein
MSEDTQTIGRARLAYQNVIFMLTWVLGTMIWLVFDESVQKMLDFMADAAISESAQNGVMYMSQAWEWFPLWLGLLAFVLIVASSSRQQGAVR